MQILGLCPFVPLLDLHVRIPLFEHSGPFSVQCPDTRLKEEVRTSF